MLPVQVPSAEELERQKVGELEQGTFRAEPTAEKTPCEISEEGEQGQKNKPGKDGF